ncbi:hypothetical protein CAPTEDRAFT_214117 [Capitella teleta]|uniref:Uncharacterized protein n=1 Tax=Capitella teleta TaxID=283909 RepID=R7TSY4_CAPTE|nr:hypothetical protein CAPTEDRAFT_214117 [Capitella teleta]|eukprot:ELT94140.1 hypothetical protein CAPTEDRAFT_214117 [Capitella teleta]
MWNREKWMYQNRAAPTPLNGCRGCSPQDGSNFKDRSSKCRFPCVDIDVKGLTPRVLEDHWHNMHSCILGPTEEVVTMATSTLVCGIFLAGVIMSQHFSPSSCDEAASMAVKECVAVCVECVQLFSKNTYDGRKCIFTCHLTKGKTMDELCSNSVFHLI